MCRSAFKAKCKDHISLVVIEKAHCRCQNQCQTQTTVTNPETTTDDAKNDWSPTSPSSYRHKPLNHHLLQLCLFHSFPRWWFHFFMFIPNLGEGFQFDSYVSNGNHQRSTSKSMMLMEVSIQSPPSWDVIFRRHQFFEQVLELFICAY